LIRVRRQTLWPLFNHRGASMRLPAVSPFAVFYRWALVLLALWLVALAAGPALFDAMGVALNAHGHAQLHAHGHPFIDARTLMGVPNAMDVFTNAPLALAGLWGLHAMKRQSLPAATRWAAHTFFVGLLLTGLGSAWYHWAPDAAGLVWDRLGMAVTFAGAMALAVGERVGQASSRQTLQVVLPLAVLSAGLPLWADNVLPWAVVQFGGMTLIVWLALRQPAVGAIGVRLGSLIGLYALAKLLESGDDFVFHLSGETVSGHSLKHMAAALAAWPVIAALCPTNHRSTLRQNAAGHAA
jgi:hypothetical protein